MSKRLAKTPSTQTKETPVVVYFWVMGLAVASYFFVGRLMLATQPHPIHWLAGLAGGVLGIPIGWLWFRWRGDII